VKSLVLAVSIFLLFACAARASDPRTSNQIVFDSRGIELMRTNKDLVGPWVSYTLARASCEKSKGGGSYFFCEVLGRDMLVSGWVTAKAKNPDATDKYLETLLAVKEAGFMKEYVWVYLKQPSWNDATPPANIDAFKKWASLNLIAHVVETHVLGEYR
jgi:hypothetical protein